MTQPVVSRGVLLTSNYLLTKQYSYDIRTVSGSFRRYYSDDSPPTSRLDDQWAWTMGKRILVLGVTGINKANPNDPADGSRGCMLRFADWEERTSGREVQVVDLFHEYLTVDLPSYLYTSREEQTQHWLGAWKRFVQEVEKGKFSEDLCLCIHGVLTNEVYGLRSPVLVKQIARDFSPDVVITLIDDVYSLYQRTQLRARGLKAKGMPTLEQLIVARRAETVVGDQIAQQTNVIVRNHEEVYCADEGCVKNYVVAVGHPVSLLHRLVYAKELTTVYLSHPISEPRRMSDEEDDPTGLDDVNEYLRKIVEFERNTPKLAVFYPATIDELPLVKLICAPRSFAFHDKEWRWRPVDPSSLPETLTFHSSSRWDLRAVFGEDDLLREQADGPDIEIPTEQVSQAAGSLVADVGWRDTTLIGQSDKVGACCPLFNNRKEISGGMWSEMEHAVWLGKFVHCMQVPEQGNHERLEQILRKGRLFSTAPSGFFSVSADWGKFFQKLLAD